MFKHLLVACDFSPPAMTAAATARQLANEPGAKVTLVNVFDPSRENGEESFELLTGLRAEPFGNLVDVDIASIAHKRPEDAICEHARNVQADLILAGRHGHHDLGQWLIGSTTERVVRHAHCSVLVTEPTRGDTLAKHIMGCTDFSEGADHAMAVAGDVARHAGASVTLLHVYDLVPGLEVLKEPRNAHPDHSFDAVIKDKLEELKKSALEGVPSLTAVLRDKSVVTAILDYASDNDADLIVTSTRGRTGATRLLLGSVAERVVRHAAAHVLVVR